MRASQSLNTLPHAPYAGLLTQRQAVSKAMAALRWKQDPNKSACANGGKYFLPPYYPYGVALLERDPVSNLPLEEAIINVQNTAGDVSRWDLLWACRVLLPMYNPTARSFSQHSQLEGLPGVLLVRHAQI